MVVVVEAVVEVFMAPERKLAGFMGAGAAGADAGAE